MNNYKKANNFFMKECESSNPHILTLNAALAQREEDTLTKKNSNSFPLLLWDLKLSKPSFLLFKAKELNEIRQDFY